VKERSDDVDGAAMDTYVRFETGYHCESNRQPLGVFRAAGRVELRAELHNWTREWLRDALDWFNANLPVPPAKEIDARAIFWFHPHSDIVREIWQLVAILWEEGVRVLMRRTTVPGRIIYRDKFQIAAIPFGHGRRARRFRAIQLN
jgi:hypothetical protein